MTDIFSKTGKGRKSTTRAVVYVEDAVCDGGGLHDLTNKTVKQFPVTYCTKCGRTSADLDLELNGERS